MEVMPILVLLLYSIPESIILISLSGAIYGYKVKENFYRIILLGISLALVTYIVRALPFVKIGLNVLIQVPLFIFLTSRYLKISLLRAFFIILTGFIIIALAESISTPLFSLVSRLSPKEIFASVFWRILYGWTHLCVMVAGTIFLLKKNLSLVKAAAFFQPKTRSGKITLLLIGLVIVQAFLSGTLNSIIYFKVWPSLDSVIFTRIIGFLLFTFPLISIFLVKRLFTFSEQEAIAETQEAFVDNIQRLFTTLRGQRHDFNNHIHIIYSMLNNHEVKKAIDYLDNLIDDIRSTGYVVNVEDPVLRALFTTKAVAAQRNKIKFEVKAETSLEGFHLKPFEVVKILGNLVDNALEAVTDQPSEFRQVKVKVKIFSTLFIFEVFNPRPVIAQSEIKKIFREGYSTKETHSGLGLALVKDLVERNNGEITVKSSEQEGTTFTVIIPGQYRRLPAGDNP